MQQMLFIIGPVALILNIPLQYTSENIEKQKSGRPENVIQQNAFIATCCFLENNDAEQLTLSDLVEKMEDFLKDTEYSAYDRRHMKQKLLDFNNFRGKGSTSNSYISTNRKFHSSRLL